MSLNSTPSSERTHIGIFGQRNAGKSSLINAITGLDLAIVSDIAGTTTDPVIKSMELLPLGPVLFIDTPGFDDEGELGQMRVAKTYQVLHKTDVAVLVVDGTCGIQESDLRMVEKLKIRDIPFLIAMNKSDLVSQRNLPPELSSNALWVSGKTGENIWELKERIATLSTLGGQENRIIADLISPGDFAVLVVPIDSAAPKGRLILPQQHIIRDILEINATAIVVKENGLKETLEKLEKKPRIVITDSQAFEKVSKETPQDILLTSFSILFERYKGNLETAIAGVKALDTLKDNDTVLISEGCTHHRQCDDIGSVKLPRWIAEYTGKKLNFQFSSGMSFPDKLSQYQLIVHCGGCMLNEREIAYRHQTASEQNVPFTNYGILIAYIHGILNRALKPFPSISTLLKK